MSEHNIFISYQWDSKPFVRKLHEKLVQKYNYTVWRDDEQLDHNDLNQQLAEAIQNSDVVLCCVTEKYCESDNCNREISYASSLKKPLVIAMLERLDITDLGGIGFIINPLTRFNFYNQSNPDEILKSAQFEAMVKALKKEIESAKENDDEKDNTDEEEEDDEEFNS